MNVNNAHPDMPDHIFEKFSRLIYDESGINLNKGKKVMLTSRLNKRLKELEIDSYSGYYDYLCNSKSRHDELFKLIDVVSTNKTDFFREDAHFNFLLTVALPVITRAKIGSNREFINIWSAGCSSGEEAYTIAVVCAEHFKSCSAGFSILATDISNRVLEKAKNAIYQNNLTDNVPSALRRKYFMMGKGNKAGYHKVVPELREKVVIKRHNLINDDFRNIPRMDIIFCRNVIIYFDRETQIKLHKKLLDNLNTGGYLFIGHSETLLNAGENVNRIEPTIYCKLK
ncbi:MAG: CheR family methyltransferase [Spirochaetota bacterium]